ncbi:hypothetical protein ACRWOO_02685 [Streptomyces sp. NEAU-PBA10]
MRASDGGNGVEGAAALVLDRTACLEEPHPLTARLDGQIRTGAQAGA